MIDPKAFVSLLLSEGVGLLQRGGFASQKFLCLCVAGPGVKGLKNLG